MTVRLLYFAWIREQVGLDGEEVTLPDEISTVFDLVMWLRTRGEGHAQALSDLSLIRCAMDQQMVPLTEAVTDPCEIALFPPVTGG
jgi:sulfur-carrier protein